MKKPHQLHPGWIPPLRLHILVLLEIWEESNNAENFHRVPLPPTCRSGGWQYVQRRWCSSFKARRSRRTLWDWAWLDQHPNYWVVAGNSAADVASGLAATSTPRPAPATSRPAPMAARSRSPIMLAWGEREPGGRIWVGVQSNNGTGGGRHPGPCSQGEHARPLARDSRFQHLKDEFGNTSAPPTCGNCAGRGPPTYSSATSRVASSRWR